MRRTGSVVLPLHTGKCPRWLFPRMKKLCKGILQTIVENYGKKEVILRISDPMFFQALGCALGFDWHSSGLTTTTMGALREALNGTGIICVGGKGKRINESFGNEEFQYMLEKIKIENKLCYASDQKCLQDGYSIYARMVIMSDSKEWCVIQQGMNEKAKTARRYHWINPEKKINESGRSIAGKKEGRVLNMCSEKSKEIRDCSLDLIKDNPEKLRRYLNGQTTLCQTIDIGFPARHRIIKTDLTKKDWEILKNAYEYQPETYEELILFKGMGKKKIRALALISSLVFGCHADWRDPIKYAFAHGGKDGIPYPVDLEVYENSITFISKLLKNTDGDEAKKAMKRMRKRIFYAVKKRASGVFQPPT